MFKDLVLKNRSYRRFYQDHAIEMNTLRELVDLARQVPSGANLQPLKYVLSCTPEKNALIFGHLAWAGYLKEWPGPEDGERPTGYIVILGDKRITINFGCDHGIVAQTILLGAVEKGLGGCMFGSIQRKKLQEALNLPEHFEILLIIALGKPKEIVKLDPLGPEGDVRYWRDKEQVHHVPKRTLDEVVVDY